MINAGARGQDDKSQRFIGVDIGGTTAKAAMIELDGALPRLIPESITEVPSEVTHGPQHVISSVIPDIIGESLKKVGLTRRDIHAFGVDFPCPVSDAGVTLSRGNMQHPAWEGYDVRSELVTKIGRADPYRTRLVCVDNDAAATMLGVAQQLPESERNKIIFGLFVGTGLGGALTIGGKNPFKNDGGGSEPGASTVFYDEDLILFGRSGHGEYRRLEEFASLVGIARQLEKMHHRGLIPRGHPLLALSGQGDKSEWRVRAEKLLPYAIEALTQGRLDDFSLRPFEVQRQVLGLKVQETLQIVRPDHVFIGGGIADLTRVTDEFRTWYIDGIRDVARSLVPQEMRRKKGFPEFHSPHDGDAAAPYGAAIMAWKARS